MAELIKCPHCPVKGIAGFFMHHHILRCGDPKKYEFGQTKRIININFKKAVNHGG